jgi:hypothetical protein
MSDYATCGRCMGKQPGPNEPTCGICLGVGRVETLPSVARRLREQHRKNQEEKEKNDRKRPLPGS